MAEWQRGNEGYCQKQKVLQYKSQRVCEKRRGEQQTTLTKLDAAKRKGGNKLSQISEDELERFIRLQQQRCLNKKKGL
jgi:hypothetical protein